MSIERQDILSDDAIAAPLMLAENLLKAQDAAFKMVATFKTYDSSLKTDSPSKLKKSTDELTQSQKELEKIQKQVAEAQRKQSETIVAATKQLQKEREALKQKISLGERDARTVNAQNASLKELEAALKANRIAYDNLATAQDRNSEEGKALLAIIQAQDEEFKAVKMSMGQAQANVGNYKDATKDLKLELKAARDEMVGIARTLGVESPEFIAASQRAGQLKDNINDINDAVKNASASNIENLNTQFSALTGQLKSGDFGGAAMSARQFASTLRQTSSKEIISGLKGVGGAFLSIGKAILMNPIFLVGAALAGIALVIKSFRDSEKEYTAATIKRYDDERKALGERYDHEIEKLKILKQETEGLEIQRIQEQIASIDKQIKQGTVEAENVVLNSLMASLHMYSQIRYKRVDLDKETNDQLLSQRGELEKQLELITLAAEQKEKEQKENKIAEAKKLADERIKIAFEEENRIWEIRQMLDESERAELQKNVDAAQEKFRQKIMDGTAWLTQQRQDELKMLSELQANQFEEEKEALDAHTQEQYDIWRADLDRRKTEDIAATREKQAAAQAFAREISGTMMQVGDVISNAINSQQNEMEKIAKGTLIVLLDVIERRLLAEQAAALAISKFHSFAQPDSAATFGATGVVRAAVLTALIKAAFSVARAQIMAFEKGTAFSPEGLAVVGEKGAELIKSPDGKYSISPGRASLTYLQRGSKVFTADETMAMLSMRSADNTSHSGFDFQKMGAVFDKAANKIIAGYVKAAPGNLVKNGSLLFEHKMDQSKNVKRIRKTMFT